MSRGQVKKRSKKIEIVLALLAQCAIMTVSKAIKPESNQENKMTTIEEMLEATVACKKCKRKVSELALFPGGICVTCHESKFNSQAKANGGALPRPNFFRAISKGN